METVILSIILILVLAIIFNKIRQLFQVIRGNEEADACQCNSCDCSCLNREDCGVRDHSDHEPHSFHIDLDTALKNEKSKDLTDNQVSNSKNGGDSYDPYSERPQSR